MRLSKKGVLPLIIFFLLNLVLAETSFAITRNEIIDIAEKYKNHQWMPTENNTCHENGIDTPDRNRYTRWPENKGWKWEKLEGGNYKANIGVPYQWGGFSSISEVLPEDEYKEFDKWDFGANLKKGKYAGDINFSLASLGKAIGVDCSGFVSRCWQAPRHCTGNIHKISKELEEYQDLQKGDILNCYKPFLNRQHVILFKEFDADEPTEKLLVYESSGNDWKVNDRIYSIEHWLKPIGYIPRSYFERKLIDAVLLIDRSGSMYEEGKIEEAKKASKYFVDIMRRKDNVGVVSFEWDPIVDYSLTEIDFLGNVKSEAKEAINEIEPGGGTNMSSGLTVAASQLTVLGKKSSEQIIILLSDGIPNNPRTVRVQIQSIKEKGIKVYVIGFGKERIDEEILREIANETGGIYYYVPSPEELQEIYSSISEDVYKRVKGASIAANINQGETKEEKLIIDSSVSNAIFSLFWQGSDVDLILVQPDGKIIDPLAAGADSDISFTEGETYEFYEINSPMFGEWTIKIYGKDVPAEGEKYTVLSSFVSAMDFLAETDKSKYRRGEPIKITASIKDPICESPDPQYIIGANIKVEAKDPNQNIHNLNLYDDGAHQDGKANDGIYSNIFDNTLSVGNYTFKVKASGVSNREGDLFTREISKTATVLEYFTHYVPADYPTIQEAINAAVAGDLIIVESGVYTENINVDKSLTIKWENAAGKAIIQPANPEDHIFNITADNVKISGFTIKGASGNNKAGIYLNGADNCDISYNTISENTYGIYLDGSYENTISRNNLLNNKVDGVYLRFSSRNEINKNDISDNYRGVYLFYSSDNIVNNNDFVNDGLFVSNSYRNIIENNTINDKSLIYLEDVSNHTVRNAGQAILVNCENITVRNLKSSNAIVGIELWKTKNSQILNSDISQNDYGIYLFDSSNNTINGNNISNSKNSVNLQSSFNNNIIDNNILANDNGISLLFSSDNNVVSNNIFQDNKTAVFLISSSDNTIYLNNFIDNRGNVNFLGAVNNTWNSPEEMSYAYNNNTYINYLGNYWSNYSGSDANIDGIGDIPYSIISDKDNYPLMGKWESGVILAENQPPIASFTYLPESPTINEVITFDASSSYDSDGEIISFKWDLGDGFTKEGKIVTHSYSLEKNYNVKLAVIDNKGEMSNTVFIVSVKKIQTNLVYRGDLNGQYSDEINFEALLITEDGGGIENKTITFTLGDQVTTGITNEKGIAVASLILNQISGNYTIKTNFIGNNNHLSSSDSVPFEIQKENIVIDVFDKEGFTFDDVLLKVKILDDDGEFLSQYNLCEVEFKVDDKIIGSAKIDKNGKAEINWNIDFVPKELIETYPMTVIFTGNEYYNQDQGQSAFILRSVKWLKQKAIEKLKKAETGNKIIDKEISLIVRYLNRNLKDELWSDASRLNLSRGKNFFHREKIVVIYMHHKTKIFEKEISILERIIEKKQKLGLDVNREESKLAAIKIVLPVFKGVVSDLVKADEILVKIAIKEVKNISVQNPKFQKIVKLLIVEAEKKLAEAKSELASGYPNKAILKLNNAWIYTQLAIKLSKK